jgi:endonuclease/exonuclease/phosphatase family metal-dependent hydrolase
MFAYLKTIIIILGCLLSFQFCTSNNNIKVMSFNIRYNNPDDGVHAWSHRKDKIIDLIKYYDPDLFGVQEALHNQIEYLHKNLEEYEWVGVGRDDGKNNGEYTAVFCKRERFKLIEENNFWLSETPEVAGSFGWDAACVRIVTWLKLEDRKSAKSLYVFNTHFDHMGQQARLESAKLILSRVDKITISNRVIVMGDFNADETSRVYQTMTARSKSNQILFDTQKVSQSISLGPDWTFQGFSSKVDKRKLDYIFVSDGINVFRHEHILNPAFGEYPSDHLPVFAEIQLTGLHLPE